MPKACCRLLRAARLSRKICNRSAESLSPRRLLSSSSQPAYRGSRLSSHGCGRSPSSRPPAPSTGVCAVEKQPAACLS
eukprot:4343596-Prymnesium_polylepis.1